MATIDSQIVAAATAELKLRDNAAAQSQAYSVLPQIHEEVIMNYRFPWAVKFFELFETAESKTASMGSINDPKARPLGTFYRVFKWPLDCIGHPEIYLRVNGSWTAYKITAAERVGNELHIPTSWIVSDQFIMRGLYLLPIDQACAGAAGGAIYKRVLELGVAARIAPNFDQGLAAEKNGEFMAQALRCRNGAGLQQATKRRSYLEPRGAIPFQPGDVNEPFASGYGGTIVYGTGDWPTPGPSAGLPPFEYGGGA